MENELLSMMKPVLDTLPQDDARKVMDMIVHEIHSQAIVQWCNAQTGIDVKTGFPIWRDWNLLQRSPIDPERTVWAMVQCEDGIAVFTLVKIADPDGDDGYEFGREVIRNWNQCSGPISHKALVATLEKFMTAALEVNADGTCPVCGSTPDDEDDDKDKDGKRANGAAHA